MSPSESKIPTALLPMEENLNLNVNYGTTANFGFKKLIFKTKQKGKVFKVTQ